MPDQRVAADLHAVFAGELHQGVRLRKVVLVNRGAQGPHLHDVLRRKHVEFTRQGLTGDGSGQGDLQGTGPSLHQVPLPAERGRLSSSVPCRSLLTSGKVARHPVARGDLPERRQFGLAPALYQRAASVEGAAGGRVDGAGHLALEGLNRHWLLTGTRNPGDAAHERCELCLTASQTIRRKGFRWP